MASLVDVRNVNAHKCVRLEIHVPAEQAAKVMEAFGWPTMAEPVPVAIARLEPSKAHQEPPEKEPRHFSELAPSQRAALLCKKVAFQNYLGVVTEADAAGKIRAACKIDSRSELDKGGMPLRVFDRLERNFEEWVNGPVV